MLSRAQKERPATTEWSTFTLTAHNWSSIQKLVHEPEVLAANEYMVDQYEEGWFRRKQKCERCKIGYSQVTDHREPCVYHIGEKYVIGYDAEENEETKIWSCCFSPCVSGDSPTNGCLSAPTHIFSNQYSPYFTILQQQQRWKLYPTPPVPSNTHARAASVRFAVALDCEMGATIDGTSELLRVSLIDIFTGEVLIDSLVKPSEKVIDWRTQYSGITQSMIDTAIANGDYLNGRNAAREAILRFVSPDTIVVAHAGFNDLQALRWIHTKIIDTCMIERGRKDRIRPASLKNLIKVFCKRDIQVGHKGHDSIEDAMATRELMIWYARCLRDEDRVPLPKLGVIADEMDIPQDSESLRPMERASGAKSTMNVPSGSERTVDPRNSGAQDRRTAPTKEPAAVRPSSNAGSTSRVKRPKPTFITSGDELTCTICKLTMKPNNKDTHVRGKKHQENLEAQADLARKNARAPTKEPAAAARSNAGSSSLVKRPKPTFITSGDSVICTICKATMQLKDKEFHMRGNRHKENMETLAAASNIKWWCKTCKISTEQSNRATHLAGKRHMAEKDAADARGKKKNQVARRTKAEFENEGDEDDQRRLIGLLQSLTKQKGKTPGGGGYGIMLY